MLGGGDQDGLHRPRHHPPSQAGVEKCDEHEGSVGNLPPGPNAIPLKQGDLLVLSRDLTPGRPATNDIGGQILTSAVIGCTIPEVFEDVRAGDAIWFDDGKIGGAVEKVENSRVLVRITQVRSRVRSCVAIRVAGHTSEQVEKLMGGQATTTVVALKQQQGLVQIFLSQTPVFSAKLIVVIILAYFLLAHREAFLLKAVKAVQDKRRVVDIAKEIQTSIARYLVSVTLLNLGLGFGVGVAIGLLGVSNALMWGIAAFLLNYVPFIGAVCGIILVAIASLIQFQNIWYACLPPLLYFALNALESNFITPQILGKWMTLNPVAIFLSFLF